MATKKTDSTAGGQGGAAAKKSGSASKSASAQKSAPAAQGGSAQKSAPKSASKSAQKSAPAKRAGGGAARKSAGGPDLRADARGFVSGRPQGWNHDEWLGFLEDLRGRGHNIEDRDAIGSLLERERLAVMLEKVEGLGSQRVKSISERYGNVWRLKDASVDALTRETKIPRPLAERILESVR
jgi:hypothetical protein